MTWMKCLMATLGALTLFVPVGSTAQTGSTAPSSAPKTWRYECKTGNCPTRCMVGNNEIFTTGSFAQLTITQVSDHAWWVRIESGQSNNEYIVDGERLVCTISNAASTSTPLRP